MNILKGTVGHGDIGLGGSLGYRDDMADGRVALPAWVDPFDHSVSAHAPSDLLVELREPTDLRGALNAGANLTSHNSGPCEFWVNDHWVGDLSFPCETTPWLHLPPGTYRLRIATTHRHWGAHSLWLGRKGAHPSSGRLALVTVGCYPPREVKRQLYWLHRTAARFGLLVHTFGIDTYYQCHYDAKVERMSRWLKDLPSCYDKVLYMDGRDTFVAAGEAYVTARLGDGVLISGEPTCWPDRRPEWSALFRGDTDQLYPNAGMWAGPRNKVEDQLGRIREFYLRCLAGSRVGLVTSTNQFDNDQYVWQAYMAYGGADIATDTHMRLFCTLAWIHANVEGTGRVKAEGCGLVTEYGTRPVCIHFPGGNTEKMSYWARWLGL
jgi:hypothetical protein